MLASTGGIPVRVTARHAEGHRCIVSVTRDAPGGTAVGITILQNGEVLNRTECVLPSIYVVVAPLENSACINPCRPHWEFKCNI